MSVLKVFLLAIILLFASAISASVIWSNPTGSADLFDWSNGSSTNGLYGDPTLTEDDVLEFSPSQFRAESLNGIPDRIYDGLEFDLSAHTGYSFNDISITFQGDYGLLGQGELNISSMLKIQNLDTLEVVNGILTTDPMAMINTNLGISNWSGVMSAQASSVDWTNIKVIFGSGLYASSAPWSVAFIEQKVLGSAIDMQIVPEPATLAFLSLGAFVLVRRTRKKLEL